MSRNQDITIGKTVVRPGERTEIMLPVADLYTSTSLGMPVQVISGRREGPILFGRNYNVAVSRHPRSIAEGGSPVTRHHGTWDEKSTSMASASQMTSAAT